MDPSMDNGLEAPMDDNLEAMFDLADQRGREMLDTEPRALSASYSPTTKMIMLALANGCIFGFPPRLVEDLRDASDDDLASVVVRGVGFNLHWPTLDADLYVPTLVAGIFGTKAWMTRELARRAGLVTSPAKAAAARKNGAKGGRPRKVPTPQTGHVTELLWAPVTVIDTLDPQPADQSPVILKMRPPGTVDIRAKGVKLGYHIKLNPGQFTIIAGDISAGVLGAVDMVPVLELNQPAGMVILKAKEPATPAAKASRLTLKRRLMARKQPA